MDNPSALIIEDQYDISIIFARAIETAGFDTTITRAGDMAMKHLENSTPDLVLLDLQLPKVPGTDILRYIRSTPRLKKVLVIIATAYPKMAEPLTDEADWILHKPVSFGQLRDLALVIRADRT